MARPLDPAKRERILDAALDAFAAQGYAGTPVPDVARRAGVATGTLYRYFSDKNALVNAVYVSAKARLRDTLLDGLDLHAGARPLFDEVWARLTRFAAAEPRAFHFLELQDHLPYLDPASRALELEVLQVLLAAVTRGHHEGSLRADLPAPVAMSFIWSAFVGAVKAQRLGYLAADPAVLVAARDATWRGIAASHPTTESP